MQKNVEEKVLAYCNRHEMFQKGDHVVLGVSGGADSVCLLFVLLALQKEWDLKLHVVHVNHGIRSDAGEDAAYVKQLCDTYGLPFLLVEKDIPALAGEWGISEEEAGRRVRYEAFEEALPKGVSGRIAVAHNSDDRAETMLFHLFRGTGLTGLGGIRPVRERIVRPILCLEREEIEGYLREKQIAYRHDSTNDSDDYTRNKIRHHILKYAKDEIVNGCVGNMNRTADILAETENYIEEQVNTAMQICVRTPEVGRESMTEADGVLQGSMYEVDCEKYLQLHSVIQKRLLLQILKELSPMHKDITAVHVEDIHSLFLQEGHRCIHLPYDIRGYRRYGRVFLERQSREVVSEGWEPVMIDPQKVKEDEAFFFAGENHQLSVRVIPVGQSGINCKDIPQNQYTKWFDYDKMKECLTFRTRESGDYLCIKGSEGLQHKKLKDYMIAEKIPREHREELPVLAAGQHVLWLVGYRISEFYKVDEDTKNILQVCYEQKKS